MGISRDKWHKRRKTGGKRKEIRSKRKFEIGRQPAMTKLGERRVHTVRGHGGIVKFKALKLDHGNYSWPGEAISRKTRIIGVVYNPTNAEFVRTNTIVKGSIIQIDATPFKNWYQKHYGVLVGKEVPFVKPKKVKKLKRGEKHKKEKKTEKKTTEKKPTSSEKKGTEKKGTEKKGTEKREQKRKEQKRKEQKRKEPKRKHLKRKEQKRKHLKRKELKRKHLKRKEQLKRSQQKRNQQKKNQKKRNQPKRKEKEKKRPPSAKHSPSSAMKKKWRLRNTTRVLEPAISEQFDKGRLYAKITTSPGQTGTADGYILEGEELAFYIKKMALKKKK